MSVGSTRSTENGVAKENGDEKKGWDGRVNWSVVISAVLIVASVMWSAFKTASTAQAAADSVAEIQDTVKEQGATFTAKLDKFQESLTAIQISTAKQDGQAAQLADHEARIRALEGK